MDLKGFIQELIKNDQLREQVFYGLLATAVIMLIAILYLTRRNEPKVLRYKSDRPLTPRRTSRPVGSPMATRPEPTRRYTSSLDFDWARDKDPRD